MIIPVLTQHYPMLQRNLLDTGVTRGKRLVVLVGRMFTAEEIGAQVTRIERERSQKEEGILDEDDPVGEDPAGIAERARRFATVKELLTATTLGTS